MNKQDQNGSMHIIVASIFTVVILGIVGFLYWSNFLKPKPEEKVSVNTEAVVSVSPSPRVEITSGPGDVDMEAWSVRFKTTDALKDADVKAQMITSKVYPSGSYTYYDVSTSRQRAFKLTESTIDQLCEMGSSVFVDRYDEIVSKDAEMDGFTKKLINTESIGGYYYYWSIPSSGACDGPDTKAIIEALKSLKTIN